MALEEAPPVDEGVADFVPFLLANVDREAATERVMVNGSPGKAIKSEAKLESLSCLGVLVPRAALPAIIRAMLECCRVGRRWVILFSIIAPVWEMRAFIMSVTPQC